MELAIPFGFACDRCERVEARPESLWCPRCGSELSVLQPPVPPAPRDPAVGAAIRRIRSGETGLAYSPRCGTSQLVAMLLYAVIIAGGGATSILFGVPIGATMLACAVLCVLAQLAAPTLGLLAQRTLTVS